MIRAVDDTDRTRVEPLASEEALKRIGECFRRRGTVLDLSGLGLAQLPPKLAQLAKLTELDLSHNHLDALPPELGQLTKLTRLDVSHNSLGSLPPGLGQLTALTHLDLSHNRLGTLPPEIGRLTSLTRLELSHNPLESLPPELGQLASLTRLDLTHGRLNALPPEIGQLTTLTRLYFSHNLLAVLPAEFGQLSSLTRLDISHNRLESLPTEIGHLDKLTVLDLSDNLLESLPPEISGLVKLRVLSLMANRLRALPESLADLEMLECLWLHGNPALELSPALLGPDPRQNDHPRAAPAKSILDFYFARLTGKTRPLNEVKLVLLGRSGAGKTSLLNALRELPFHEREAPTEGPVLCDCTMDEGQGPSVTAHVWDFPGKEIHHALHPFFLGRGNLYVVVLSGRDHHEQNDAEYWLRLIEAHGTDDPAPGPPVIVAMNQWNVPGCRPEVDRIALRERYPFIRGFVEMDCKSKKGISVLKTALCRALDRMPWVREPIPEKWDAVRHALTDSAAQHPCLGEDAYRALCAEQGVVDEGQQNYLADILHHLGVALNYRNDPRVQETAVLQPAWFTKNLHALLLRAEKLAGLLQPADVDAVLHAEKDEAARTRLMELMVRFGMANPLPGGGWSVPRARPGT
jgi:internalin A